MPFAVDAKGRVYCSDHGDTVEGSYSARLREYQAWRQQRADAITALEVEARGQAVQRPTGSDGAE